MTTDWPRIRNPSTIGLDRFREPAPTNPILRACDFLHWSQDKRDENRRSR